MIRRRFFVLASLPLFVVSTCLSPRAASGSQGSTVETARGDLGGQRRARLIGEEPLRAASHDADAVRAREPSPQQLDALRTRLQTSITITNCRLTINGVATDIGDITASLTVDAGDNVMKGTFSLDPTYDYLCACVDFHWIQVITDDDCPATIAGVAPTRPVVDPPKDGWDYMYDDGVNRTQPNNNLPNYGYFIDVDPWYYNSKGEAKYDTPCKTYAIRDLPSNCDDNGTTSFKTWLVAVPKDGTKMCLIAGYSWKVSSNGNTGPSDLGVPAAGDANDVSTALTHGNFTGWTVDHDCNIPCNPPKKKIKAVQDPSEPDHAAVGDTVFQVAGVVTAIDNTGSTFGFYFQNNASGISSAPWNGVDVFTGNMNVTQNLGIGIGDSVEVVVGRTAEISGGTAILSPNGSISAPDIAVLRIAGPDPINHPIPPFHVGTASELNELIANPSAEQWEGSLVRVNGPLRVARSSVGSAAQFILVDDLVCPSGSLGPCDSLLIDGLTLTSYNSPPLGTIVDQVQGVFEERDRNATRGYRVLLRDFNDIAPHTGPNLSDAFPIYDNDQSGVARVDSVMVVFDRAVEQTSAENTANYQLASFGAIDGAQRLPSPNDNRVVLKIRNGLSDGNTESITVSGVLAASNLLPMTTPQMRTFQNGVLTIANIQTPDPSALGSMPCSDRSRYAGAGPASGQRLSYRGIVTTIFGNLNCLQDAAAPRSGLLLFAPIAGMKEGDQYLVSGMVRELLGETEALNTVYLRDEGPVTTPAPLVRGTDVLSDATCDQTQTLDTGEDYEGVLVTVQLAQVAAFTNPPSDPIASGSFNIFQGADSIQVANQNANYGFDADAGHVVTVTGVLRPTSTGYQICPRNDADIVDYGPGPLAVDRGVIRQLIFTVRPNPARTSRLHFVLPRAGEVEVAVFDVAGRRLATPVRGRMEAGDYTRTWNGSDDDGHALEVGVYFIHLRFEDRKIVRTQVILR